MPGGLDTIDSLVASGALSVSGSSILIADVPDELLDPLRTITAASSGAAAPSAIEATLAASPPASAPARRRRSAGTAAGVRATVQALDDSTPDGQAVANAASESAGIEPERLAPITRPDGGSYRPRLLGAERTDVEALRACRAARLGVLLEGYPGCGKTALVEAAFGDELITVEGHGDTEVADLIGSYTQEADGSYIWIDGPLVVAMREGRPLFIDDATLIPAGVAARFYPAADFRRRITVREHQGEQIEAADGFFIIAAHNPGAPGAVLSEALASRFTVRIAVGSDLRLAQELGVPRVLVRVAARLQTLRGQGTITWAPEMRELLAFVAVAAEFDEQIAACNLIAQAPEECRDEVAELIGKAYPAAAPLALGS